MIEMKETTTPLPRRPKIASSQVQINYFANAAFSDFHHPSQWPPDPHSDALSNQIRTFSSFWRMFWNLRARKFFMFLQKCCKNINVGLQSQSTLYTTPEYNDIVSSSTSKDGSWGGFHQNCTEPLQLKISRQHRGGSARPESPTGWREGEGLPTAENHPLNLSYQSASPLLQPVLRARKILVSPESIHPLHPRGILKNRSAGWPNTVWV